MADGALYVGVGTPQGNPTVEIEFRQLLRPPVHPLVTRLTSSASDPSDRLLDYIEQLPRALQSFDDLPLRAFAFACTGSSYLLDPEREEAIIADAERRCRIQVITATQAVRREMQGRGASRIALLSPYPDTLHNAAIDYWQRLGHRIVAHERIDVGEDTRSIYEIGDQDVAAAIERFDTSDADLLLLSGTGMRTLAALADARIPAISSNLCLATELLRRAQRWPANEAADVHALLAPSGSIHR